MPAAVNHPEYNEIYPTTTADGSIYYFCTDRPDSLHADIYVNRREDGEYSATERLSWPVNTDYIEFDFIVAPDDSYLLFASDRPGGYGQSDSYICFHRDDGSWTHPVNMGSSVNSYCVLAELRGQRGDVESAVRACEQAIELNPDFRDARTLLERLGSDDSS